MGRRLIYIRPAAGYLPLTTAWIAATLETDTTILNALNTFEAGLIANSLTTKFNAIYPMVGGTPFKHSFNFINTLTFQLSFNGFWSHSATGALPNGINAYADTFLTPSTTLTNLNTHLSFYSRTSVSNAARVSIGSANFPTYTTSHQLLLKWTDGNAYGTLNNNSVLATYANATSTGWYMVSRTANNSLKSYKNNSLSATNTTITVPISNTNKIFIAARNDSGSAANYDNKECAFASIGSGLSDAEASTLYTLIQAFQTSLSRQV
jgi:hypothetical protein